jgi:hypothetical protein
MWLPLAMGMVFLFFVFLGSGKLSTLRARGTSAIWAILVPCGFHWLWGSIFDIFLALGRLSTLRARGTSAIWAHFSAMWIP